MLFMIYGKQAAFQVLRRHSFLFSSPDSRRNIHNKER